MRIFTALRSACLCCAAPEWPAWPARAHAGPGELSGTGEPKGDSRRRCGCGWLLAESQPLRQTRRQSGIKDLLLRRRDVVLQPAQLDKAFFRIVNHVSGFRVVIPRLADRSDIDEILLPGLDLELRIGTAPDHAIPDE